MLLSSFSPERKFDGGCLEANIILVADLSGSVEGHEIFIVDALKSFVQRFELSDKGIRIGYIRFATYAVVENHLTGNKLALLNSINKIDTAMTGGFTDLTHALQLTELELSNNARKNVLKIVILISDGDPDEEDTALEHANYIKRMDNVLIYGVYVDSKDGDKDNMKLYSSRRCFIDTYYEELVFELQKLDICL